MLTMRWMGLAGVALAVACSDYSTGGEPTPSPVATVFTASGNITAKVDEFRTLLGASNGGTAGEQPAGRREINWDGAGADPFNNRNDFPADFFNTNVKAGAVYTTAGTGFRNDSTLFKEVNDAYGAEFNFFTPAKVFAPVGGNQLDQLFQVAGQPTPAVVRAFGIVLSDVDLAGETTIELFAQDGSSLGIASAPVRSDAGGLSFVGVAYEQAIIARVRITLGTGALGANTNDITAGGAVDLVVPIGVTHRQVQPLDGGCGLGHGWSPILRGPPAGSRDASGPGLRPDLHPHDPAALPGPGGGDRVPVHRPLREQVADAAIAFRDQLWTIGSFSDEGRRSDVWASRDGRRWERVIERAPWSPAAGYRALAHAGRLWVLDGTRGIWSSEDGRRWTHVCACGPWPPDAAFGAVSYRGRLWVMGDDARVWSSPDGVRWSGVAARAAWGERFRPTVTAYDDRLSVLGGVGKSDAWWSEDGVQWTRQAPEAGWFPRGSLSAAVLGDALYVMGGKSGVSANSNPQDVWRMRSLQPR